MAQIQHHGIKGMKWGVRRKNPSRSTTKAPKEDGAIKANIKSIKREISTSKKLKNIDNISTEELRSTVDRVRNENHLKRLGKNKEYIRREKLSDAELKEKVERLQLEDNLNKEIRNANSKQIEIANDIIKGVGSIAINSFAKDGVIPITGSEKADRILTNTIKQKLNKGMI